MATFVVTVFEVHKQRVRVEATSAKEALVAARDGDGDYERRNGQYVTEFVETSDSLDLEVETEDEADKWQGRVSDEVFVTEPVPGSKLARIVGVSEPLVVTDYMIGALLAQVEEPADEDPDADEWSDQDRLARRKP